MNKCLVCEKDTANPKFCSKHCQSKFTCTNQWKDPKIREKMIQGNKKQMLKRYKEKPELRFILTRNCHTPKARKKFGESRKKYFSTHPQWCEGLTKYDHPGLLKNSQSKLGDKNPMKNLKTKNKVAKSLKRFYLEHPEKHPNHIMRENGRKTSLEKQTEDLLILQNREFKFQYPIPTTGKFVDFYLPKEKIIIEADGEYWHKDKKETKKRDIKILNALNRGWKILHYSDKFIKEKTLNFPKYYNLENLIHLVI